LHGFYYDRPKELPSKSLFVRGFSLGLMAHLNRRGRHDYTGPHWMLGLAARWTDIVWGAPPVNGFALEPTLTMRYPIPSAFRSTTSLLLRLRVDVVYEYQLFKQRDDRLIPDASIGRMQGLRVMGGFDL
jgi:hypothetical protein